jgi:hypothetical protein
MQVISVRESIRRVPLNLFKHQKTDLAVYKYSRSKRTCLKLTNYSKTEFEYWTECFTNMLMHFDEIY